MLVHAIIDNIVGGSLFFLDCLPYDLHDMRV